MIANFLRLTAPWVAGSSPLPFRHIRGGGWLEVWRCPFDCQMRHEVPNLQSIYLLKMYRNPFTLFLIAGEAHAKCRVGDPDAQSCLLYSHLIARLRHEVPNWFRLYIFHTLFSYIPLSLSAFPISFLPIAGRTQCYNFLFSFLYIILTLRPTKIVLYFSPLHS